MFINPPQLTTDNAIGQGRVVLALEYDGDAYHGWQFQKSGVPTIEQALQKAVAKVADHPVDLVCAGRTDAGVHASCQIVHFETTAVRSLRSWVMGINTALPGNIAVHWAGNAAPDFHARFSAIYRRYRYLIMNNPVRPGILRNQVSWVYRTLDAEAMNRAAQALVGEHDFSSFRAAGCQSRSPQRFMERIEVTRHGDYVVVDVQANAFLHHMVRNIAGALIAVGSYERPERWIREILEARNRKIAGVTAPPFGLYLVDVGYPDACGIPKIMCGPDFARPWFASEANLPRPMSQVYKRSDRQT
ncbi:tRNA pseudouridine(38-40) synthase TruA [Marinobacter sp. X15-166B]|uniref:tRNA pseudouridine(38-40) synthase TruA n=1 Tax=Marinobacter sp. X15-166B TaxID=1897620 RepID=UPI00085CCD4D|nr:tRNA pseudouridine(38-40) synthase TruA [Marinobacter sp. X15-166B]OEY67710.1 tRNA pseudouridine(38-40) synthase TruA [Marinobacter sp. X15-166B]